MTHDGVRRRAGALFIRCAKQATARLLPASGRISLLFLMAQAAADRVRAPVSEDRKERVAGRMVERARALEMVLQCDGGGDVCVAFGQRRSGTGRATTPPRVSRRSRTLWPTWSTTTGRAACRGGNFGRPRTCSAQGRLGARRRRRGEWSSRLTRTDGRRRSSAWTSTTETRSVRHLLVQQLRRALGVGQSRERQGQDTMVATSRPGQKGVP